MAGTLTGAGPGPADYFSLEVFVHALELSDPSFVEATLGFPGADAFPRVPYAVAFQFLDYPLLLVYAREPALSVSGRGLLEPGGAAWYPHDYLEFDGGKSCVLQADPDELAFLLEQVMDAKD